MQHVDVDAENPRVHALAGFAVRNSPRVHSLAEFHLMDKCLDHLTG